MKIIGIKSYRDGGSIGIVTTEGEFWIDHQIRTTTEGAIYVGNINDKTNKVASKEQQIAIMNAFCYMAFEYFKD